MDLSKEFIKTGYGFRAFLFTLIPLIFYFILFISCIVFLIIGKVDLFLITLICAIIMIVGVCITELQYGNMLKDYANNKKQKN